VIVAGTLVIPDSLQSFFPRGFHGSEISLSEFPPFDVTMEHIETFDFANYNQFIVKGQVVGIDTIYCDSLSAEIAPLFKVDDWSLTSYYPRFLRFHDLPLLGYLASWTFSAITVLIFVGMRLIRR